MRTEHPYYLSFLALAPLVVSKCAHLFFGQFRDILPYGRVILLPYGNSDIEAFDFSFILFALKLPKAIPLVARQIQLYYNKTRLRGE